MKKNIKKIIVGMFAFVLLFSAQNAFAATWNGASNDCKGISIVNATTNEGYGNPCWPSSSISADAGDTLNVRIYYHNTGTTTANNTKVVLNAPTGSASSSKSFSGSISSDQGGLSLGSVVANLSSSQTITFNSVKWYTNNTSETLTPLLNGQSGAEILSGGLNLGSIAPGWATQGSLVVSFHVSNTTAPQLCQDTTASNYGGALPCTYPAQLCRDTAASNYLGALPCTYPAQLCRDTAATNYLGALPCTYPPTPICSISNFTTNTSSITSGGSAFLSWNTSNCTDAYISSIGTVATSGSQTVYPASTITYTLNAHGSTGSTQTKYVTINVQPVQPQLCRDIRAANYLGALPCTYPVLLCRDTTATNYLGTLPCVYPIVQICRDTTASNYLGTLPCVYPIVQICRDTTATNYLGALPCIYYQPTYNTCRVTSFYADDTSITNGESTLLRWTTENCTSVSIPGVASGLSSSGSYRIYPNYTKTYTLNAYGSYGSDSSPVTIYVDDNNNTSYCSIDSFTASGTYVNSGSPITLRWNTSNCSSLNLSNIGNVSSNSSVIVYPTSTTTYTLSAYGNSSVSRSIQVNVNYINPIIPPVIIYNSNVVTTVATNISQTGAQLNGLITNTSYTNSNVHFEYGTSVNLGLSTAPKTLTGNTNFSEYISGLSPYTIYYFQAVSEGSNGVSRGAIEVFRTLGTVTTTNTTRTIVVQGTTVVGSESPIMLKIENRYQSIGVNDIIEYTVTYKNIGNVTLTNPILQVIVPKGIILTNYTKGTYAEDTNTLTVQLSDLAPGEEGSINLQGQVVSMPSDTAQIVTTAVLVYTNRNGSQENAMAYVLNSQKLISNNLLGASAFFSGIFPSSLIGWLLFIILILILILVARSLYNNRRDVTTTTTQKTISH